MSFAESSASVIIEIEQEVAESAETFRFRIEFKAEPPKFIMDDWKADPLTCTDKDASWSVQLPAVTTEDVSPVVVNLVDNTDLFVLEGGIMSLVTTSTCPSVDSIDVKFSLKSDVLGLNDQTLTISLNPPDQSAEVDSETPAFAGVVIPTENSQTSKPGQRINSNEQFKLENDEEEAEPVEPLRVDKLIMTPKGNLKVKFSKEILPLPFVIPKKESNEATRELQTPAVPSVTISDAITLEIDGADEVEIDKSIA